MNIAFPLLAFGFGLWVLFQKEGFYSSRSGVYIDLSEVRWILGPFSIAVAFLWTWHLSIIEGQERECVRNQICPKCNRIYPIKNNEFKKKCPECEAELMAAEAFLEHIKKK